MNQKIVNKVVNNLKNIYKKHEEYLPYELYDKMILEVLSCYNEDMHLNFEIYLFIELENRILKELCLLATAGNIDIEVDLIDKYYFKLRYILDKMHLSYNEKEKEDILITSIETYKGEKIFSLHILQVIREKIQKEILKTNNDETVLDNNSENINRKNVSNNMDQILNDLINNFTIDEKLIKEETFVEYIFNKFNLIELVDMNDENFYKFVYLKYGYYNNTYFSINDIAIILNIKVTDAKKYYAKSLDLLKGFINEKIDEIQKYKIKDKYLKNNC